MMTQEARTCDNCGYDVRYMVISDAHDPGVVKQFVAVILKGDLEGRPAVTDFCPSCDTLLTPDSTSEK